MKTLTHKKKVTKSEVKKAFKTIIDFYKKRSSKLSKKYTEYHWRYDSETLVLIEDLQKRCFSTRKSFKSQSNKVVLIAQKPAFSVMRQLQKLKFTYLPKFNEWVLLANPTKKTKTICKSLQNKANSGAWFFDVISSQKSINYYDNLLNKKIEDVNEKN